MREETNRYESHNEIYFGFENYMCYRTHESNSSWGLTNGRVSRGSGESLDVARKGKFTRLVFNKMIMERKNKGRDRSPGMLL